MMKKLKIRYDADPKELEKYLMKLDILDSSSGEEYLCRDVYCCVDEDTANTYDNKVYSYLVQFYINEKREISYCTYPECRDEDFILEKVYDLIKAGLLIKEEEDE